MNILIQGSARRVKLTKGEVKALRSAGSILREISVCCADDDASDAVSGLSKVIDRLDDSGVYSEAVPDAEKTDV